MSKRKQDARAEARAILAARKRAEERRKRLLWAGSAVGAVILVVGILVAVKLSASSPAPAAVSTLADPTVVSEVTGVPAATLNTIGQGKGLTSTPDVETGKPVLKADGKPLVLYMGAEFCPYCAAERWAIVEALSRFGTFKDLGETFSASKDTDPNTPTLTFHGASYTSDYITFQSVEMYTNQPSGSFYGVLEKPTAAQAALMTEYTKGSFPFIDFGDQAVAQTMIDPAPFAGKNQSDIARVLADPTNAIAQAEGGAANAYTTIICSLTGGQPTAVCSSPAAQAYQSKYGAKT